MSLGQLLNETQATAAQALVDTAPGLWHVLHTKPRQEKALAADLLAMDLHCFLPLVKRVCYHGRRKSVADVPLFSGYIFLRGALEDAYSADRTGRVANIIRVSDQARIDWELHNIQLALERTGVLEPHAYLTKGVRVEVISGPFRGLQGVVEERLRNQRLILQVKMLGQASSLEIDGALLERLE